MVNWQPGRRLLPPLPWKEQPRLRTFTSPIMRVMVGTKHANLPEAVVADLIDGVPVIGDLTNYGRIASAVTDQDRRSRMKRLGLQLADEAISESGQNITNVAVMAMGIPAIPGIDPGQLADSLLDWMTPTNTILHLEDSGRIPSGTAQDLADKASDVSEWISKMVETIRSATDITKLPVPFLASGSARVFNTAIEPMMCMRDGDGPIACTPRMWDQLTGQWTVEKEYPYSQGPKPLAEYFEDTRAIWA